MLGCKSVVVALLLRLVVVGAILFVTTFIPESFMTLNDEVPSLCVLVVGKSFEICNFFPGIFFGVIRRVYKID